MAQTVNNLPTLWDTWVQSLGREESLEKGMATHSSILAWEFHAQEKPGGLQPVGSQRIRHDWGTYTLTFHCRRAIKSRMIPWQKERKRELKTSLEVQWLRLHVVNAGSEGSTPGWWTKILHFMWCDQKVKKKCQENLESSGLQSRVYRLSQGYMVINNFKQINFS